jgi:transcriptional regulator with XRE-family HTH domain
MNDRLKVLRKSLKLNQTEFARRLGLTQTALSMIELGKVSLTEKNIRLICSEFGVNDVWLREGQGEMFGENSPYLEELLEIFARLSPGTQEFLLDMARRLLEKQRAEEGKDGA